MRALCLTVSLLASSAPAMASTTYSYTGNPLKFAYLVGGTMVPEPFTRIQLQVTLPAPIPPNSTFRMPKKTLLPVIFTDGVSKISGSAQLEGVMRTDATGALYRWNLCFDVPAGGPGGGGTFDAVCIEAHPTYPTPNSTAKTRDWAAWTIVQKTGAVTTGEAYTSIGRGTWAILPTASPASPTNATIPSRKMLDGLTK